MRHERGLSDRDETLVPMGERELAEVEGGYSCLVLERRCGRARDGEGAAGGRKMVAQWGGKVEKALEMLKNREEE